MKTIEETIQEILAEHHESRWMDTSELEAYLRKIVAEQKAIDDKRIAELESFVERATNLIELEKAFREHLEAKEKELRKWLQEEAELANESAKNGYDAYEIGGLEERATMAEDTINWLDNYEKEE